jgi:hypothetical protein
LDILISKINRALVSSPLCNFPRLILLVQRYLCDQKSLLVSFSLLFTMVLNVNVVHVARISLAIGGGTRILKSIAAKQVSWKAIFLILMLLVAGYGLVPC